MNWNSSNTGQDKYEERLSQHIIQMCKEASTYKKKKKKKKLKKQVMITDLCNYFSCLLEVNTSGDIRFC
jgi:hypothetical protein